MSEHVLMFSCTLMMYGVCVLWSPPVLPYFPVCFCAFMSCRVWWFDPFLFFDVFLSCVFFCEVSCNVKWLYLFWYLDVFLSLCVFWGFLEWLHMFIFACLFVCHDILYFHFFLLREIRVLMFFSIQAPPDTFMRMASTSIWRTSLHESLWWPHQQSECTLKLWCLWAHVIEIGEHTWHILVITRDMCWWADLTFNPRCLLGDRVCAFVCVYFVPLPFVVCSCVWFLDVEDYLLPYAQAWDSGLKRLFGGASSRIRSELYFIRLNSCRVRRHMSFVGACTRLDMAFLSFFCTGAGVGHGERSLSQKGRELFMHWTRW